MPSTLNLKFKLNVKVSFFTCLAATLLNACGGSSGGDSQPAASTPNTPTTPSTPVASTLSLAEQMRSAWPVLFLGIMQEPVANLGYANSYACSGTQEPKITVLDGRIVTAKSPDPSPIESAALGKHVLSVSDCFNVKGVQKGVTSMVYTATKPTANATANTLQIDGTSTVTNYHNNDDVFQDFTMNGSGDVSWSQTKTSNGINDAALGADINVKTAITPTAGTTVLDHLTQRTFAYVSGSATTESLSKRTVSPIDAKQIDRITTHTQNFNDLTYRFGTDVFKLTGTLINTESYSYTKPVVGTPALSPYTNSGKINVYRHGVLVGFITQRDNWGDYDMSINGVVTPLFSPIK